MGCAGRELRGSGRSGGRGSVGPSSARQTDQPMAAPGRSAPDSGPNCVRASVKLKSTIRDSTMIDRAAEPERRLMAAVLQGVVDDHWGSVYRGAAGYGSQTNLRRLRAAVAYVASRDRRWPFSFENLCEALSLDSGRLRHELRKAPVPGTAHRLLRDGRPGALPYLEAGQGPRRLR
jgi:hypothetical protein